MDARTLLEAGLSIVPAINGEKRPVTSWKQYQSRLPNLDEFDYSAFQRVGIVCGKVSGNLEVIDFDDGGSQFNAWSQLVASCDPELLFRLVIEQTPSGGYHVLYRCTEIGGNVKLASKQDGTVLIETRGQGGFVVCAPSDGYKVTSETLLNAIPEIMPEDRKTLIDCARALNVRQVKEWKPRQSDSKSDWHLRPGDDFNERVNFPQWLAARGWVNVVGNWWRRPGKDQGWSADWNGTTFVCFTTSTTIPDECCYDQDNGKAVGLRPFQVYAFLEHDGDFTAATKALIQEGYGERWSVDLSYLDKPEQEVRADLMIDDYMIPESTIIAEYLQGTGADLRGYRVQPCDRYVSTA